MIDINVFLNRLLRKKDFDAKFLQYHHIGSCEIPCVDCPERDKRIYENGFEVKLPAHPNCDCKYKEVETKKKGNNFKTWNKWT